MIFMGICLSACGRTRQRTPAQSDATGGSGVGVSGGAGVDVNGGARPEEMAGAGNAGEAIELPGVHIPIRERSRNLSDASGAFAGDALGVVGITYDSLNGTNTTLLGIEGPGGFQLTELSQDVGLRPRIAAASQGFFVTWGDSSALHLSEIGLDGATRQSVDLTTTVPRACGLAAFESTVAVACESGESAVAFVCNALVCTQLQLADHQLGTASPEVIWDGEAFAIARASAPNGVAELSFYRLSRSGGIISETTIAGPWSEHASDSSLGLARRGERVLLAYDDVLLEVEPTSATAHVTTQLARSSQGSDVRSRGYDLLSIGDQTVLVDSTCDNGLERSHGDAAWRILSAAGSELSAPEVVSESCIRVSLAASDSGRVVLLRTAPSSLVVEDLDVSSKSRGPARLLAGAAEDTRIGGMACRGASCTFALFDPGIELSVPSSFHLVEVADAPSDGPVIPTKHGFAPVLLTDRAETIVFDEGVSWLDADMSVRWSEPWLQYMDPGWDVGKPWALGGTGSAVDLWQLSAAGLVKHRVPLADGEYYCGTTHRAHYSADDSLLRFEPLFGEAGKGVTLPTAGGAVCGAGQVATFTDGAQPARVHRARASGERLPDETLPGTVVAWASDQTLLLLTTDVSQPGPLAAQRYMLYEFSADQPPRRQVLELPEPGAPARVETFAPGVVQARDGFVHLLWTSKTQLMLSRWPQR